MGRREKTHAKTLHQQAYEKMVSMQAFGQSKLLAKQNGTMRDLIFSYTTYKTYWRHIRYYLKWLRDHYPACATLKKAKKHVNEWLEFRVAQGCSAWTIHLELAALAKLFGILPDNPNRFKPPQRLRANIKRSRHDVPSDQFFSVTANEELINFVCATGTRRNVLERLRGDDLWTRERMLCVESDLEKKAERTDWEEKCYVALKDALTVFPDHEHFIFHRKDKNGLYRFAPIITEHAKDVVERMENTAADELVWPHVHKTADIHSFRAEYATHMYKRYAREIDQIPYDRINKGSGYAYQSDVYVCRNDAKGKRLDKAAMYKCSRALGHKRIEIVANNYIRGI